MTFSVKYILLAGLLISAIEGFGQDRDSTDAAVEELIEQSVEDQDPEGGAEHSELIIQALQELIERPLDINSATTGELLLLPGINLGRAQAIVVYRDQVKPFERVEELVNVEGIGRAILNKVSPFVTVGPVGKLLGDRRFWLNRGRFEILSRFQRDLEKREGYRRNPGEGYTGGPARIYQRMNYRSPHLSANLTLEKDPGERIESATAFDYRSGHLAIEEVGLIRKWVIGDYAFSAGQGLLFWNGGVFGKGRQVISAANRSERGVQPWRSSREYGYYRGTAITLGTEWQVTGLYSGRRRDARRISDDTVRLVSETGLHRTLSEIEKKEQVSETVVGGRIRKHFPFGFAGLTGYLSRFGRTVIPGDRLSDRHDFEGRRLRVLGADFNFSIGSTLVFGELGRSANRAIAVSAGVETSLNENTELVLVYRNYDKRFQSLYGDGFGEQSGLPANEEGFYIGLRHSLMKSLTVSGYVDQFRFPSPRFGTSQETGGFDWLGLLEFRPNSLFNIDLQVRGEIKEDEYPGFDSFGRERRLTGMGIRKSYRLQIEYRVGPGIRLRSRGELVVSREAGGKRETGYLMYQDLRISPGRRWRFDARATIFDTESFSSRIYQFENDMLYVFSSKVLFNRGQRVYLLVKYEPFSFLEIWGKFGMTVYEDQPFIGSGLDRIEGNRRRDVGVQMRIRF